MMALSRMTSCIQRHNKTALSMMTLNVKTFSVMTFSVISLNVVPFSVMALNNDIQCNGT